MVGLNALIGLRLEGRRAAAWLALVTGVFLIHAMVMQRLADRVAEFSLAHAMPPRIEVAYVREMALAEPPATASVPAAPRVWQRSKLGSTPTLPSEWPARCPCPTATP